MDTQILLDIGLSRSQANAYHVLVKQGALTPPQLSKITGESRTASYMALAKLQEIGLAESMKTGKKLAYQPLSPSNLNRYIEDKRRDFQQLEAAYRTGLTDLLNSFYASTKQPGIRYFEGAEGLRAIYEDHISTGKDLYLLRTQADELFFSDWLYDYMDRRAGAGIKTKALLPYDIKSYMWAKKNDTRLLRTSVWYPKDAYSAPVEMSVYGDKVSIISFKGAVAATVLENPQVAEAFRQLFELASAGVANRHQDSRSISS